MFLFHAMILVPCLMRFVQSTRPRTGWKASATSGSNTTGWKASATVGSNATGWKASATVGPSNITVFLHVRYCRSD